jgi:four helix bundle suffix protein
MPAEPEPFLPKKGNYHDLLAYRKSELVYDLTYRFTQKHLQKGDRTVDQMIQAARSGKQNIAEGSKAGVSSAEMELKLMNVARASLEELLIDFKDYLRVRDRQLWDKASKEALFVRKLGSNKDLTFEHVREIFETRPPEIIANMSVCFIYQTTYLLDALIKRLQQDFVKAGGIKEQMLKARLDYRRNPTREP